jgi:hypothetical protein
MRLDDQELASAGSRDAVVFSEGEGDSSYQAIDSMKQCKYRAHVPGVGNNGS